MTSMQPKPPHTMRKEEYEALLHEIFQGDKERIHPPRPTEKIDFKLKMELGKLRQMSPFGEGQAEKRAKIEKLKAEREQLEKDWLDECKRIDLKFEAKVREKWPHLIEAGAINVHPEFWPMTCHVTWAPHRTLVEKALTAGQHVPDEVLEDYWWLRITHLKKPLSDHDVELLEGASRDGISDAALLLLQMPWANGRPDNYAPPRPTWLTPERPWPQDQDFPSDEEEDDADGRRVRSAPRNGLNVDRPEPRE